MTQMRELADWLKQHDHYVVLGHVCPDGDASGSAIAMAEMLRSLGKRAFAYLPGGLAKMYRAFYEEGDCCSGTDELFTPETAFVVDVSTADRLGEGKRLFDLCKASAVLDHHATNEGFGDVALIDGEAAATGELAVQLIRAAGAPLSRHMATWLYAAISTDCGQFGYSSTRPETLEAAAECVRAGIDVDAVTRELYRTRSEGRTRLLGLVLSGLEIEENGQIAWARLTEKMLEQAHALREDNEGIVNYLLEIRGVRFAALAEERGAATKFSLRSKPPFDVARSVAVPLGGGGHACAAGVTLEEGMDGALEKLLALARAALKAEA